MTKFTTENLILLSAQKAFAEPLLDYYTRNKDFFERFDPKRDEEFYSVENMTNILQSEITAKNEKKSYRFYVFSKKDTDKIIGFVGLNNIVYGCFWSCFISYKLDKDCLNRGFMTEAVKAVVDYAFDELKLHRIEGNVLPDNVSSLKVLDKNGFKYEGVSEKYLKINDVWRDHIHMVKLNPKVE
ncbi:MAG TPA: GNAT family protein [Clostridia bacterium]|nr:GNAT family protein [Clostridia bacterium]